MQASLRRSPLAMGLLGGAYTAVSTLPADDIRGRQPDWLRWFTDGRPNAEFLHRIDTVRGVLTGHGRTLAHGALGWIWAHHPRTIPLPGFRNNSQVQDNATALTTGPLTDSQHRQIELALNRAS